MPKSKLIQMILMLTCQLTIISSAFATIIPEPRTRNQGNRIVNTPRTYNPSKLINYNIKRSTTPVAQALARKPMSQMMTKDYMCRNKYQGSKKTIICTRIGF